MHNTWLKEILTDGNLDRAFNHVIKQRMHYPDRSDVWIVMERWAYYKLMMIKSVMTDKYRISPMIKFKMPNIAGVTAIWSTIDAILIKSIATYLSDKLTNNISDKCTHLKTHGGLQMATKLTATYVAIKENCFYFRGDVANFYHDIDHDILIGKIKSIVPATEEILLKILCQVIRRT